MEAMKPKSTHFNVKEYAKINKLGLFSRSNLTELNIVITFYAS
uniref:Uncharacterized protein n=1 Tax=Rhizophora mucronata TaxID=61149 RepID=A0A2P2NEL0_RHIMU